MQFWTKFRRPQKSSRLYIFLAGTPASGKTTLSYSLAEALHHPLIEFHPHDPAYTVFYDRMLHAEKGCIFGDIPQEINIIKMFEQKIYPNRILCIYIKTDPHICALRSCVRFHCPRCHRSYHQEIQECTTCHAPLKRKDMCSFTLSYLNAFKESIEKNCIPYFKKKKQLIVIDGSRSKEEIFSYALEKVMDWIRHDCNLDLE